MKLFETNKIHTIIIPEGNISETGQFVIKQLLYFDRQLEHLPVDWQWVAKLGGRGEYIGSFAKRIAKFYHQRGVKLDSDFLGEIGSLVAKYTLKQSEFNIDFTQSFDWDSGDFGDGGSCFWGCRSCARKMLMEVGAYAIRFYANSKGYARAWIAPVGDKWVCFNGYGLETSHIAQVVAAYCQTSYKYVHLYNYGEDCGSLWINSGSGYLIGPECDIKYGECVDLQIEGSSDKQCIHCGEWLDEDSAHYVNNDVVCEDCLNEYYTYCENCGDYYDNDYMTEIDGYYYCEGCRDDNFTVCEDCDEWVSDTTIVDSRSVCDDCLRNYSCCEHCGDYFPIDDCSEVAGHGDFCANCVENNCSVCDDCQELCFTMDCEQIEDCIYCAECATAHQLPV